MMWLNQLNELLYVFSSVTNAIRLGKKGDKPCLLKITVDSEQAKAHILKNCVKLRNVD